MTKAPLGGESTGRNPTDRSKSGTKRSLLTEAAGIPTGLAVGGANVHDIRLRRTTLRDALMRSRGIHCGVKEHLCMDKGYDSAVVRNMVENVFDCISHVRSRGEEKKYKRNFRQRSRRWVVERTHSWMNRFRAIRVRWDKKLSNNIAGLHLTRANTSHLNAQGFSDRRLERADQAGVRLSFSYECGRHGRILSLAIFSFPSESYPFNCS